MGLLIGLLLSFGAASEIDKMQAPLVAHLWAWALGVVAVVWIALTVALRGRDRRAKIIITIPETGWANSQVAPHNVSSDDLSLLALCYASKLVWLLKTEPAAIAALLPQICNEAIDSWSEPGADLIDRMPSARRVREDASGPKAVAGGERFVITLHRTDYTQLRNKAWVANTLPRPGMSGNVPLSFLFVLNSVFVLLKQSERDVLGAALSHWCDSAFDQPCSEDLEALHGLFEVSLNSWLRAKAETIADAPGSLS